MLIQEAEVKKMIEEQAKKEHEEYLMMKTAFSVEEEGHVDVEHSLNVNQWGTGGLIYYLEDKLMVG